MYLSYGTYNHQPGECDIAIVRISEYNDALERWAVRERWDVNGILVNQGADPAAMNTQTAALIAAYASDGNDLILKFTGGTSTTHALLTANCLGGTKVLRLPSFPSGRDAEAVTFRTYALSVEGLLREGDETLLTFSEQLTFSGGGRAYGHIETLTGLPVLQKLRNHTIVRATQSGSASGIDAYPLIPGPLWPEPTLVRAPQIDYRSPRRSGSDYFEFPVSWRYEFQSAVSLLGTAYPHKWGET